MASTAVAGVRRIAKTADLDNIDAWWARVAEDIIALVAAGWAVSRELAEVFLGEHAAIEGRQVVPVPAEWDTEQVATSLRVTGPVAFKQHITAGGTPVSARATMGNSLAGSAERLVLAGERDTVDATVEESDEIVGWRRVSDGDPCAFCAMLVSRGAVYKDARSAGDTRFGGTAYHDRDGCTAVPLYEHEEEPAEVADLYQQWLDATAGKSGDDALRAWRRYWDDRNEPAAEPVAPTFAERLDGALTGDDARAAAPLSLLRPSEVRGRGNALRPDEALDLATYKGSGFSRVNPWLREGEDGSRPDLAAQVREIDNAIARSPLADDIVVHRGIVDPSLVFGDAAGVNLAGAVWRELAYVSTSTAEGPARGFALFASGGESAVMRILVPKGTGAVELSNGDYESELLLQRGLRMRVVADSGPGTRPRTLDVEVLP